MITFDTNLLNKQISKYLGVESIEFMNDYDVVKEHYRTRNGHEIYQEKFYGKQISFRLKGQLHGIRIDPETKLEVREEKWPFPANLFFPPTVSERYILDDDKMIKILKDAIETKKKELNI